jgi:hypothetical protein
MKKLNSKKIKFAASGFTPESILKHSDIPSPAKNFVPEWYRDTKNIKRNSAKSFNIKNIKDCVPFADSMLSGYIWTTPADIYVEKNPENSFPMINVDRSLEIMDIRESESAGMMPVPDGCYDTHFVWKHTMHIETPKGYSVLITQPLNRHDLPFISLSGIVDCDANPMRPGNYPFFIKKNFEGLIPKGTPALQIIPIKRENWISEKDQNLINENSWLKNSYEVRSQNIGWYKKNYWFRKSYN